MCRYLPAVPEKVGAASRLPTVALGRLGSAFDTRIFLAGSGASAARAARTGSHGNQAGRR
jgi:hypothetical protein